MDGIELDIPIPEKTTRRKRRPKEQIEEKGSIKEYESLDDLYDSVSSPNYEEPSYDAEIVADVETPKSPNWQEKLGSLFTESVPKLTKKPRTKAAKESLQKETAFNLTVIMAIVLVFISDILVRDPYKPCIANEAESQAIMSPLARMIARRLDLAGKISEDTADIIAMCVAMTLYSNRVFWTIKEINALTRTNTPDHTGPSDWTVYGNQQQASPYAAHETTAPESGNGYQKPPARIDPSIAALAQMEHERRAGL